MSGTGTVNSRITLTAYGSGAAPIVNHSSGTRATAVTLYGAYMTVSNLAVTSATGAGVNLEGSYETASGMTISNAGEGVRVEGANATMTYDRASDLIMENNTPGGDDDYGAVGYDIQAANATVTHDSCINCKASSDDFGYDGGFVEVWESGNNLYVADNLAQNDEGFFEAGGDSNETTANNITMVDNVLNNDDDVALLHNNDDAAIPATNFTFEQNTVYQTGVSNAGQMFDFAPGATETIKNNIFDVNSKAGSTPTTHTNNLYFENGTDSLGYSMGSGEKTGNVLFVNAAAGNFHLQSGSPALGMGATGLGLALDYDGVTRSSPPDAGAYQYTG